MKNGFIYSVIIKILIFPSIVFSLSMPLGDITRLSTMKENQITGFGMVVGLPQTGDRQSPIANLAIKRFLENAGFEAANSNTNSRNIAAVMVMAKIPPMAKKGDSVDLWISSIGDAKSLAGGYLLQTPLKGADGIIYGVAQTPLPATAVKTEKNTFYVINGGIMEKEIPAQISSEGLLELSLRNYDFNTAQNAVNSINKKFPDSATLNQQGQIKVKVPQGKDSIAFLSEIYLLPVEVHSVSRVVIDSANGTIIMGADVGISGVVVTRNGLNIEISDKKKKENSANNAMSEKDKKDISGTILLEETPKVSDLVDHLNKLGLGVHDIIEILKGIHKAGALHGELIIL